MLRKHRMGTEMHRTAQLVSAAASGLARAGRPPWSRPRSAPRSPLVPPAGPQRPPPTTPIRRPSAVPTGTLQQPLHHWP